MLLVISLAFFLAPNYGPLSLFKNQQKAADDNGTEIQVAGANERSSDGPVFVSRRILQLFDDDGNLLDEPIINEPDFGGGRKNKNGNEMEIDELALVKLENNNERINGDDKLDLKNGAGNLFRFGESGGGGGVISDISGQGHRIMSRNLTSMLRRRQNVVNRVPIKKEFSLVSM